MKSINYKVTFPYRVLILLSSKLVLTQGEGAMRAQKTDKPTQKSPKAGTTHKKGHGVIDPIQLRREVELKAYYNFLHRQQLNKSGNEISDWLEAEKDIASHAK